MKLFDIILEDGVRVEKSDEQLKKELQSSPNTTDLIFDNAKFTYNTQQKRYIVTNYSCKIHPEWFKDTWTRFSNVMIGKTGCELCAQVRMNKVKRELSLQRDDELKKLALKYGDQFIKMEPKLYADAIRKKVIQPTRKRPNEWTAKDIQDIADNYTDLNDFINNENAAYQMAVKMGIKDDIVAHMSLKRRKLSFEDIQKIASPFKHKVDFERSDPAAYKSAYEKGWLDKLKEWIPLGNKENRMVYAYEFRDKKGNPLAVYVGLTYNEERRDKQHRNIYIAPDKKESPVYRFIVDNKIKPIKKILSDGYIPYRDAIDMECYYQNDFYKKDKREDGSLVWKPLHSMKCGGLGGFIKWTEEKLRKEALKYNTLLDFNKYGGGAPKAAKRIGIYDDITKNMIRSGANYYGRRQVNVDNFNIFINGKDTDLSQLNLINFEGVYKKITPKNEGKFLRRFKSIINKNNLKLSGKNNKNTISSLFYRLYTSITVHDKMNPDSKWISYLFPNHVYGMGESKLSLMGTLNELHNKK